MSGVEHMYMALRDKKFMAVIDRLCDQLRRDPNGDISEALDELMQEVHFWERNEVRYTLGEFFLNLYQQDVVALKRDYSKVVVTGGKPASVEERVELLRCLHGALQFYYGEDYSDIMELCDEMIQMRELEGR